MLVALAARNGWDIDHLDVVTVFLNQRIETDVYIWRSPTGYKHLRRKSASSGKPYTGSKTLPAYGMTILTSFLIP